MSMFHLCRDNDNHLEEDFWNGIIWSEIGWNEDTWNRIIWDEAVWNEISKID